jgi:aryl-alcohol dehydrogenase-like predicted oxidoreductase
LILKSRRVFSRGFFFCASWGLPLTEFVAKGQGVEPWEFALKQQIYLGDDAFVARMQKKAGLNTAAASPAARGHKAQVSQIHTSTPARESDLQRYAKLKAQTKEQRNQNIADAFYQGGHSQTAIALAFEVSTSTVSRVIVGYER